LVPVTRANNSPVRCGVVPTPCEPKLTLPGLALAIGDQSLHRVGGEIRAHTSVFGIEVMIASGSNCGGIEVELLVHHHVGGERRRLRGQQRVAVGLGLRDRSVPRLPPAPGRFSTRTAGPNSFASRSATTRGDVETAAGRGLRR